MNSALLVITEKLKEAGMSTIEIDHLLARFLEEEAFDYVKFIEQVIGALDVDSDLETSFDNNKNKLFS